MAEVKEEQKKETKNTSKKVKNNNEKKTIKLSATGKMYNIDIIRVSRLLDLIGRILLKKRM